MVKLSHWVKCIGSNMVKLSHWVKCLNYIFNLYLTQMWVKTTQHFLECR